MENLFALLEKEPLISICGLFILAILLVWILRHQIVAFVKKRYNLYSEDEIKEAFRIPEHQMYKIKK